MNTFIFLGPGLLKTEKKPKTILRVSSVEKKARRAKRAAAVENFLREILGTHLVKLEKKF